MPGTQRDLGVADAFDPWQNVDAGVAYLRRLTDEFGTVLALAAYNAVAPLQRYPAIQGDVRLRDKETCAYVQAVLDRGRAVSDAQAPAEQDPLRRPSARRGRDGRCVWIEPSVKQCCAY